MSKLPFTVSPDYASFTDRVRVSMHVQPETRFSFRRIVFAAVCGAFAFGALAGGALASDGVEYEVIVEMNGQVYVADSGLSAVDCEQRMDELTTITDERGVVVHVPYDVPVYCVAY